MANNKLKAPFFLDRVAANEPRGYIIIDDINGTRALTIGYTEHPAGTSLETLLTTGDQRNYKVYKALLTQTSTNAPVATILENNIGTITWARSSEGVYTATCTGAFPAGYTYVTRVLDCERGEITVESYVKAVRTNDNVITVTCSTDGVLSSTPIEIQKYIIIDDINGT